MVSPSHFPCCHQQPMLYSFFRFVNMNVGAHFVSTRMNTLPYYGITLYTIHGACVCACVCVSVCPCATIYAGSSVSTWSMLVGHCATLTTHYMSKVGRNALQFSDEEILMSILC